MSLADNINTMIAQAGSRMALALTLEYEWSRKGAEIKADKSRIEKIQDRPGSALVAELWDKKPLYVIAEILGWSKVAVCRQGLLMGLPNKRHIFDKKPNQRQYQIFDIVNVETGVFYNNCRDAARAADIPYRTMQGYLAGDRKNKTSFIILR